MILSSKLSRYSLLLIFLFTINSCADFKLHYAKENTGWEANTPPNDLKLKHSMYLVGDAGGTEPGAETPAALTLLGEKLKVSGKNSTVVFLGDNLYPDGLAPKKKKEERANDEYRLKAQLDVLKGYEGGVHFIAGNHDWYTYGLDGVKRQKKFIEEYLDREDVFYPKPGCGDPKEIEINDQLVLILVDSQWYLEDWDGEYEINNGCEIKSKEVFARYFEEAVKGNRGKNVVIATHHPPYSKGPHGGHGTLKNHLFPLEAANKNLLIPLPVLGSGLLFLRGYLGHKQDITHPNYRDLTASMIGAAQKNGSFIFASGHEHNLQHIEKDNQTFIVSGAGSKKSPSGLTDGTQFAYGHQGFAQIDFYEDGSAWLQFWAAKGKQAKGEIVYRKKIKDALPAEVAKEQEVIYEDFPASVNRSLTNEPFGSGPVYEFFWGKHYRKAYSMPIDMPSLDLEAYKGGVNPVKRGGGYQTNSLRLEGSDEKQYAMRSIDKDASRTLNYPFNESIASDVIRDNFSAAHPLAALAVPPLAEAAGIYYSNPELYYLPPQKRLGNFNEDYQGATYLVEERPDDEAWGDAANYGFSEEIMSTTDMLEEVLDDHDHRVDFRWTMRSRLFDMLIGDWDRHDDQWRWAQFKKDDTKIYRPIPRDRDQAFSHYDGPLLGIARQTSPNLKKLQLYKGEVKKIQWLIYNARHFDRTFLSGVEWKDWQEEAQAMKKNITDELIEETFKNAWPKALYDIDAPKIIKNLKIRRDNLEKLARDAYLYLAREVDVIGTNEKDLFEVERLDNQRTKVSVYNTNKNAKKQDLIYERTFLTSETKEIVLYGLDDDDFFNVSGVVNKGIKVRIVGGLGDDQFLDKSKVGAGANKTLIYDTPEIAKEPGKDGNYIEKGPSTKVLLKEDPKFNTLYRRSLDYEFNFGSTLPSAGFNVDEGILLGIASSFTRYGFKKSPYAALHKLSGQIALATSGIAFNYSGEFLDVLGNWELQMDARFQTPMYSINYYGLGNESINPEAIDDSPFDISYNRVSQRLVSVMPAISRRLNSTSMFSFGPVFESIKVDSLGDEDEIRYINSITDEFENQEIFDGIEFLGARAILDYDVKDNLAFPTRGLGFKTELGWKTQLDHPDNKSFAYINSAIKLYLPFDRNGKLVLGTRVGVQHRFNNNFEFYQGAILGGIGPNANLRGFRRERFIGRTAFYQNIDLRWKVASVDNEKIPFSMGILGGFDHGRVWLDGENSDTWHYSYGGGVFISPLDIAAIHLSLFYGDGEQKRFVFGGAFFF